MLLPLNCSCLDRCLHLPRLLAWEALRLLLPPCRKMLKKKFVLRTKLDLFFKKLAKIWLWVCERGFKDFASPGL